MERFVDQLRPMGLPAEPVSAFLRLVYTVLSSVRTAYEAIEKGDEGRVRRLFEVDDRVVRVLQEYELMTCSFAVSALYKKHANIRFYRFRERSFCLASQTYLEHLDV